jgi:hypothetical protein
MSGNSGSRGTLGYLREKEGDVGNFVNLSLKKHFLPSEFPSLYVGTTGRSQLLNLSFLLTGLTGYYRIIYFLILTVSGRN